MNEFGSNVERHRRELLVHCYRMLGSLPDAEDAVQETLLRAWRYRDSLKEGAPLRPWLYRVATNACLDAIARDERRAVLGHRYKRWRNAGWKWLPATQLYGEYELVRLLDLIPSLASRHC